MRFDAMNYVTEYNKKIQSGEIVAPEKVKKIYKRLSWEIEHPGKYIFDERAACRPINFIERFCKHSKGEWCGRPVILELFQKAFISALFGFKDKETGYRRFREALLMMARKNGKTTLLSGIGLYMMIADHEPGAAVYSAATKKDQARLVFDECRNMVSQSPELRAIIRKRKSDLYCSAAMSTMQALGKNSDTLDGLNSNCIILDELHGIKDRRLYEVLKQSQSARRQPLTLMITTAGTVRECIFDDMYNYAENIINETTHDDTFLPVIYELDSRAEWKEPKMWVKANPGLGVIKKYDDLEAKVERAKNSPHDLNGLLVKDFDIRENRATTWLSFDDIENRETFDLERFRGCYAIGGADLSITTDLTCATILLVDKETEKRYVKQMYWIPEDNVETRIKEDRIPYDLWHDQGLVRYCSGNTINYHDVTVWFLEMVNVYGITPAWVYYDSYSAKYWVEEMQGHGFNMVRCIQGAKTLSLPMEQLGQDLKAKKVIYDNNNILKWCLSNTAIQTDRNGNIVPIKDRNPKRRIDGTASLLDAYVGLMEHYNEYIQAL